MNQQQPPTPEQAFLLAVTAAVRQHDKELHSARIKAGIAAKKAREAKAAQ